MLQRFLTGIISVALLGVIMVLQYPVFAVATIIVSFIATYELLNIFEKQGIKTLKLPAYIGCVIIAVCVLQNVFSYVIDERFYFIFAFIYFAAIFANYTLDFSRKNNDGLGVTVFTNVYILIAILSLNGIRLLENGPCLIWILFIGSWGTDVSAYLVGVTMGKHKILPHISPKKTLEGFIGGIIGCGLISVGFVLLFGQSISIPVYIVLILGLLNGFFSQVGDWSMSALKRKADVKDFGTILPGHGGIMDRFDSLFFIAPFVLGALLFFI